MFKKLAKISAISLISLGTVSNVNAAGPVLLQDANTSNTSSQINTNLGGSPSLNVAKGKDSFLKFAIASHFPIGTTGASVNKATLRLFVNSVKAIGTFNVYSVNNSWSESGIKNSNQPTAGQFVAGPITISQSSYQQYVEIDVTNQVKDWLDNVEPNNGLVLVSTDGLSVFFDSKENATSSHEPEIEILMATTTAEGAVGPQGPKGDTGAVGPQGPKGDTGATGLTGSQGVKGDTGAVGPQGPKGDTGLLSIPATTGQTLIWNGTQWQAGTLAGDVAGSASNNTVQKIQGKPVSNATPTAGQTLVWDGSQWKPGAGFGIDTGRAANGRVMSDCAIGEIRLTAGFVGQGIPAKGQLLSIAQNQALFSLLGTQFGGNGTTTFALPDLRSVAPNGLTYTICHEGLYPSSN